MGHTDRCESRDHRRVQLEFRNMAAPVPHDFNRLVFDSGTVRIGAFRCDPEHPSFHDSGPACHYCFVFPRTAVEIQHEHERSFVANPNVVTFYNRGQEYRRNVISPRGDRCDWFGLDMDVVRDVVRACDPAVDDRPEQPFRLTRGFSNARTYLLQRQVFERATGSKPDTLAIEETAVFLLDQVVRASYAPPVRRPSAASGNQRDAVHEVETILSRRWDQELHLRDIARETGLSVYHLCRMFRRVTGCTLHQYRSHLRIRSSLEKVCETENPLVDIALEAGFSSHSHFTSAFHREFGGTPSAMRTGR
jgi:AraC family transcriptional regulator